MTSLVSCIRIVTSEMNIGISELVQKKAFIQYSQLIITSWTVVRIGQKGLVGVIVAVEMLISK